jgi:hypothetical protein
MVVDYRNGESRFLVRVVSHRHVSFPLESLAVKTNTGILLAIKQTRGDKIRKRTFSQNLVCLCETPSPTACILCWNISKHTLSRMQLLKLSIGAGCVSVHTCVCVGVSIHAKPHPHISLRLLPPVSSCAFTVDDYQYASARLPGMARIDYTCTCLSSADLIDLVTETALFSGNGANRSGPFPRNPFAAVALRSSPVMRMGVTVCVCVYECASAHGCACARVCV